MHGGEGAFRHIMCRTQGEEDGGTGLEVLQERVVTKYVAIL